MFEQIAPGRLSSCARLTECFHSVVLNSPKLFNRWRDSIYLGATWMSRFNID